MVPTARLEPLGHLAHKVLLAHLAHKVLLAPMAPTASAAASKPAAPSVAAVGAIAKPLLRSAMPAPVVLDRVTLYNAGAGFTQSRYFNGSTWLTWSALINGNLLVNGSVGAEALSVAQLSAITATIGLLRTSTSGQRFELDDDGCRVYDSGGVLRVRIGVW
jgi:hypothetical protein